jgi:hypothetical protein
MKRTIIALAVFAALTGNAFATNKPEPRDDKPTSSSAQAGAVGVGVGVSDSRSSAVSRNTNVNANRAEGGRASSRAQGGDASQSQGQFSTQNNTQGQANTQALGVTSTTSVVNATINPSDITVRNTGDAMGFAAPPSAVCALTGGAGVAVPGFGGSVSGSSIDTGCEAREFARVLVNLGQPEAGIRVLCEANESVARNVKACADIDKANKERAASNKASDTRPTTDSMN